MGIEIERKFLVDKEKWENLRVKDFRLYKQGYISVDPHKVVRIRLAGNKGYLTIKGKMEGVKRAEFEYPVSKKDALELLDNFCESTINKKRFKVHYKGDLWEVDEFLGENAGLVIAEIELKEEHQYFEKPAWILDEVTHDERYYNANLSVNPYREWGKGT